MARALVKEIKDTRKNYIINGDMSIAQRGTSFVAALDNTYTVDRWIYKKTGAMVHTVSQDTDVPTLAESGRAFQNSVRLNLTTPDTSIAAGDYCLLRQRIEGYNFVNFAQKKFTVSFWVKATLPGVYCISCENGAGTRTFAAEYTINAANTWEYKSITVDASPSSGVWNYTNGIGIHLDFVLAAGTTFQGTGGSWQNTGFFATANQINGVNTGATDFRITGVMLNEGDSAAPFRLFAEDFEGELAACQRYYETGLASARSEASDNTTATARDLATTINFSTHKRIAPVIDIATTVEADVNIQSASAQIPQLQGFRLYITRSVAGGYAVSRTFKADAEL